MTREQQRTAAGFTASDPDGSTNPGPGTRNQDTAGPSSWTGPRTSSGTSHSEHPPHTNRSSHGGPGPCDPSGTGDSVQLLAEEDVPGLRLLLPHLSNMSDHFIRSTKLKQLMELNEAASSAAKAKSSGKEATGSQKHQDPEAKMAANVERLRDNPVEFPAQQDNRMDKLHDIRVAGGIGGGSQEVWKFARSKHGLDGVEAIACYDLETVGMGGHVTGRGWLEIHNAASANLSLKLFSSSNVGHHTLSARRITFSDNDDGFNVGESMKEISDLQEFKTAFRALRIARHFAMPWDMSINAIEGFLFNSDFGAAELNLNPQRAAVLTTFVNYILGLNAQRWNRKMSFLDTGDIENQWPAFVRTRVAACLPAASTPVAAVVPAARPAVQHQFRQQSRPAAIQQQANTTVQLLPQQAAQGGLAARAASNAQAASGFQPGNQICRRYNYAVCPNPHAGCFAQSGTRLWHVCNVCFDKHPRRGNH